MAYNITLSDGVTVITVPDGNIYNTYSIPIVGQNSTTYGDDVARAQLRHLENFAAAVSPDVNVNIPGSALLTGQLWYDTAAGTLKVYNGTSWIGLLEEGSDLDVDGSITPSADSTYDLGSNANRWATGWFDNINVGATATINTANITALNATSSALGNATASTLTMSGIIITDPSDASSAGLRVPHGVAPTVPTNGDIWTTTAGLFVRVNGSTVGPLGAGGGGGVTSFNGRSGVVVPEVADYSTYYPRRDAGASTIAGGATWTFNNVPAFASGFTTGSSTLVTNLNADLLDGQQGSFYATDTAVVHIAGTETVTGAKTFSSIAKFDVASGDAVRILANNSTITAAEGYYSIYLDNDATQAMRFGTTAGNAWGEIRVQSGALRLYAIDALKMNFTSTSHVIYIGDGTNTAMMFTEPSSVTGNTTHAQVADYNDALRNVGFNEIPDVTVASGTLVITAAHMGTFIRKTSAAIPTISLTADSHIPVGGTFLVWSDGAFADGISVVPSGVTLTWVDGGGIAPPTGTRTIERNGIATIRKGSSTNWLIWGAGLS